MQPQRSYITHSDRFLAALSANGYHVELCGPSLVCERVLQFQRWRISSRSPGSFLLQLGLRASQFVFPEDRRAEGPLVDAFAHVSRALHGKLDARVPKARSSIQRRPRTHLKVIKLGLHRLHARQVRGLLQLVPLHLLELELTAALFFHVPQVKAHEANLCEVRRDGVELVLEARQVQLCGLAPGRVASAERLAVDFAVQVSHLFVHPLRLVVDDLLELPSLREAVALCEEGVVQLRLRLRDLVGMLLLAIHALR